MPPEKRALAVGFANGGSAFGAVLAPPLTAWWAGAFGWRGAFLATAALGVSGCVGWHLAFRGLAGERLATDGRGPSVSFGSLLGRPEVRRLLIARFFFDPVFYFYMFWIPQYLSRERGLSLAEIGALTWIPFFALGVTNISGRPRLRHARRARMATAPRTAHADAGRRTATPASWLVTLAGSPHLAIALMSVLTMAHGIWIANFITLIGDTVAPEEVGTAVGLTGTAGGIAAHGLQPRHRIGGRSLFIRSRIPGLRACCTPSPG